MDTEERISLIEKKIETYDNLVARLVAYAGTTKKGRLLLAVLGVSP